MSFINALRRLVGATPAARSGASFNVSDADIASKAREFLRTGRHQYRFRSTEAIAKHVGQPVSRVREVLADADGVRRNRNARETWTLA